MKTLRKPTLVMLLLVVVLMVGCKKDENNGNNENTETVGHKNPNPAQDTPLSEHFLAEFESIYQLYPNPDGSFYALASGEHTDYLLRLDNSGYVQQRTELGFRSRKGVTISGENIVLMGNLGYVSSLYGMYEQGYVAVYDRNMQVVATTVLKDPLYKIEMYSLIQDAQDPTLFYAGGAAIDESYVQYPYLCTLRFSDGLMTKVSSKIYSDNAKRLVIGMVEKQSDGQKDLILETYSYSVIDNPYDSNSSAIHIMKLNYFEEESGWGSETWDVSISGSHNNSSSKNNSIDSDENNIYFFGYCNDDKSPAPSSGGYWRSGCITAVNWHLGQTSWTKTVSLSNKDDQFYDGMLLDGYLYAWGCHSGLRYNSTMKYFANGLVAKFTLSGELIAYKTFGEPERNSFLYSFAKDNNDSFVCVGKSGKNLGSFNLVYSGWFLKTDLSSNGSSKAIPEIMQDVDDEKFIEMEDGINTAPMDGEMRFGGR